MNIQFAVQNGVVYVLEVNPRASRTVPFVSKTIGLALARSPRAPWSGARSRSSARPHERVPPYFSVKEAVFPFNKFPEADPILGRK